MSLALTIEPCKTHLILNTDDILNAQELEQYTVLQQLLLDI